MPEDLKAIRIPVMMSERELDAIERWQHAHRVGSRGEAIRLLIKAGLGTDFTPPPKPRRAIGVAVSRGTGKIISQA